MRKILILSFLAFSCAGSPPKMEHAVKLYIGDPASGQICRLTKSAIVKWAKKSLAREESKQYVNAAVREMFKPDDVECIDARDPKFKVFGAYSFEDISVMLRYQENLLYSCERWKQ